jgi:hypothetical protein
MKQIKLIAMLVVMAGALATPAHALKLKDFSITQSVTGDEYPAIRVKFDRAADNWTIVTGDMVEVRIWYQVEVEATHALANSEVRISLDGMSAEEPLTSTNINLNELHAGTLRLRKPGNQLGEIKQTALDICKTIRGNGGKPNKEHRITRLFSAHGHIDAYTTATWFTDETADTDKLMRVDVVCEKDPTWHGPLQPSGVGLAAEERDFKVLKVDLFLTTFENQYTTPSAGLRCKKLQVKVRIETSKAGQLGYKIWRQPGDEIDRVKFISHQASGPFKGRFVHEEVFVDTFNETTYAQYMVETAGSPVGVSTPWKDKHIICTGPGEGGLTMGQGPGGNPADDLPKFKVTDANVMLQRLPGNACPARVRVTASYRTNMPGSFEQHVGCSNGFTHSGSLEAKDRINANTYAVKRETIIEVPQTGELTCSARPIQFGQELALKKLLVQCAGPSPGIRAPAKPSRPTDRR